LDDGLVIWFAAPASFTGEDIAELHIHGGRATVEAVTSVLATIPDLRLAEPGEFSKRAFLSGKIDLTEAEAITDLVDAGTEAQRRQALAQLGGGLAEQLEAWRADLIDILAHTEAWIDFPDEDLPADVEQEARARISALAAEIRAFLDDNRRGERLRDGFQIAILGAPNAGKSSLLNAIASRDAAIVSATEGTTRDVIEVHLDLGGWPVTIADTAGLRDAAHDIEREGVRRALERAVDADLRLVVFDASCAPDLASVAQLAGKGDGSGAGDCALAIANKVDLVDASPATIGSVSALGISAKTGEGVPVLLRRLEKFASEKMAGGEGVALTRLRHRTALVDCAAALDRAALVGAGAGDSELVAEGLRVAARALGRVTGRVDVEDLLDVIFNEFCIGK
jgi:tRNA modification GTPase